MTTEPDTTTSVILADLDRIDEQITLVIEVLQANEQHPKETHCPTCSCYAKDTIAVEVAIRRAIELHGQLGVVVDKLQAMTNSGAPTEAVRAIRQRGRMVADHLLNGVFKLVRQDMFEDVN